MSILGFGRSIAFRALLAFLSQFGGRRFGVPAAKVSAALDAYEGLKDLIPRFHDAAAAGIGLQLSPEHTAELADVFVTFDSIIHDHPAPGASVSPPPPSEPAP